jgi:hypothetical protein
LYIQNKLNSKLMKKRTSMNKFQDSGYSRFDDSNDHSSSMPGLKKL